MAIYKSSCHCGAVRAELETETDPAEVDVRECQCAFCRAHSATSASDPNGRIRYMEREAGDITYYQFGTKSCEAVICRHCGVYMGAVMRNADGSGYATTNIKHYEDRPLFTRPPRERHYDDELFEERQERRRQTWTPLAVS